ncbi:hypothetical protein C499_12710 [Halogeometricum borinquense DSM 11551]|uniref:Uncharacterized protein n=1 Tax=Halogeometricum borinquense (strain ATCC 700274 / DSM 11551 / JCM 10706 / KCTC 4070 / PR3) TaxID=469382 RepID=E4NWL4_HALBP|nr:hypothetical protein [Halogeometricum borinquense]ADQ69434.1 hypothetical protein Hbor_37280 [Halogeometricum borinquense DSM 11551]ELY25986.1 hypothetical protein C499_12710 [Halogeometricum borinquense DSM 11551]
MTPPATEETTESTAIGPITDLDALRDAGVPFFEETDTVEEAQFELLDNLDDLAPVGVVNEDGEVLVMRVSEDCTPKIPSAAVEPGEDYAAVAQQWVRQQAGIDVTLDGVEGVWTVTVRLEDEAREATRNFVVFAATPETGDAAVHEGDAFEADWYAELPDDAADVPGTNRFFD